VRSDIVPGFNGQEAENIVTRIQFQFAIAVEDHRASSDGYLKNHRRIALPLRLTKVTGEIRLERN